MCICMCVCVFVYVNGYYYSTNSQECKCFGHLVTKVTEGGVCVCVCVCVCICMCVFVYLNGYYYSKKRLGMQMVTKGNFSEITKNCSPSEL